MQQFSRKTLLPEKTFKLGIRDSSSVEFLDSIPWLQKNVNKLIDKNKILDRQEVYDKMSKVQIQKGETVFFQEEEFNNFCILREGKVLLMINREKPLVDGNIYDFKSPQSFLQSYESSFQIKNLKKYNRYFDIENNFLHFIIDVRTAGQNLRDFSFLNYEKRWMTCLALTDLEMYYLPKPHFIQLFTFTTFKKATKKLKIISNMFFNMENNIKLQMNLFFENRKLILGQTIYAPNDPIDGFYILKKGDVEIQVFQDKKLIRVCSITKNQMFGIEKDLFSSRTQKVIVKSAIAKVYFIEKNNLFMIYKKYPSIQQHIQTLYNKIQNYQKKYIISQSNRVSHVKDSKNLQNTELYDLIRTKDEYKPILAQIDNVKRKTILDYDKINQIKQQRQDTKFGKILFKRSKNKMISQKAVETIPCSKEFLTLVQQTYDTKNKQNPLNYVYKIKPQMDQIKRHKSLRSFSLQKEIDTIKEKHQPQPIQRGQSFRDLLMRPIHQENSIYDYIDENQPQTFNSLQKVSLDQSCESTTHEQGAMLSAFKPLKNQFFNKDRKDSHLTDMQRNSKRMQQHKDMITRRFKIRSISHM